MFISYVLVLEVDGQCETGIDKHAAWCGLADHLANFSPLCSGASATCCKCAPEYTSCLNGVFAVLYTILTSLRFTVFDYNADDPFISLFIRLYPCSVT
jgi:hypothetical protein